MRANYRMQRLFVPDALAPGGRIEPSREQAHYLSAVLRKSEGDRLLVFNGRDGEWLAAIEAVSKKAIRPVSYHI